MKDKIISFLNTVTKRDVIGICTIITLIVLLCISVGRCSSLSNQYEHNLKAMQDTLKIEKTKSGDLMVSQLAYQSTVKDLKKLNEDLYKEIEDMKLKSKASSATKFESHADLPPADTTIIVKLDTIYKGFKHQFAFNDEWRSLEGNIHYFEDKLNLNIMKDYVKLDYTVAIDKDSRVYIKTSNPYVRIDNVSAFTLPKQKQKRISVGPAVMVGYDFTHMKPAVSVGASLQYGLIYF